MVCRINSSKDTKTKNGFLSTRTNDNNCIGLAELEDRLVSKLDDFGCSDQNNLLAIELRIHVNATSLESSPDGAYLSTHQKRAVRLFTSLDLS